MKLSINKKRNRGNNSEYWVYLFLLFTGFIFVLNFSYSTSPLTPYYWGGDTAQFLTIGKAWCLGKIPYKEMFDHKGPFIFFVDMVGFALTRGKSTIGVFALQVVFMLFSLIAFYKIGRLFLDSASFGIMTCLMALICTKLNYVEGNTVEEYCVPFIAWSLYGIAKWFKGEDHALHDPMWAFVYGLTFGVCLPQVCLLIGEIACSIRKNGCEGILSIVSVQILCWFMGICILDCMSVAPEIHRNFKNRYDRGWDSLIAEIPEEDKNSFVAYGDNRLKELYLLNDIMPCYKYFSIQEWHASMSTETREKIHATFATNQAKWILVGGETTVIDDVLKSAYKLVDSNENYMLYRLNT